MFNEIIGVWPIEFRFKRIFLVLKSDYEANIETVWKYNDNNNYNTHQVPLTTSIQHVFQFESWRTEEIRWGLESTSTCGSYTLQLTTQIVILPIGWIQQNRQIAGNIPQKRLQSIKPAYRPRLQVMLQIRWQATKSPQEGWADRLTKEASSCLYSNKCRPFTWNAHPLT